MKKTEWYPRYIRPVRSGWYEVCGAFLHNKTGIDDNKDCTITFRYFDVDADKWIWQNPDKGLTDAAFGSQDKWRGLTEFWGF